MLRDSPSGRAAQRKSPVRPPRCTRRGRRLGRLGQQKKPGVITQLHELQLAEEAAPGYCSAVPPAAMRQASLPAPQRAARTRSFCLTVLLCVRGAVLQPRATSSRRWTITSPPRRWLDRALGEWLPQGDLDHRIQGVLSAQRAGCMQPAPSVHVEVAGTHGAAVHAPRRGSRAAAAVHVPRCARLTALRPRF